MEKLQLDKSVEQAKALVTKKSVSKWKKRSWVSETPEYIIPTIMALFWPFIIFIGVCVGFVRWSWSPILLRSVILSLALVTVWFFFSFKRVVSENANDNE